MFSSATAAVVAADLVVASSFVQHQHQRERRSIRVARSSDGYDYDEFAVAAVVQRFVSDLPPRFRASEGRRQQRS